MTGLIDLADAKAVLARAQRHYREYNEAIHGTGLSTLWDHRESFDGKSEEWFYSISIKRDRLVAAKPILADAATNVTSALDHVIAAIAKATGAERKGLFFPRVDIENFNGDLANAAKKIGEDMAKVLASAREKWVHETPHVAAAREITNRESVGSSPIGRSAFCCALPIPGQPQRILTTSRRRIRCGKRLRILSWEGTPSERRKIPRRETGSLGPQRGSAKRT